MSREPANGESGIRPAGIPWIALYVAVIAELALVIVALGWLTRRFP